MRAPKHLWISLLMLPGLALAAEPTHLDILLENLQSDETLASLRGLGLGIAVLFLGWLLARLLSWLSYKLLCKTEWDNRLAAALRLDLLLENKEGREDAVERFGARLIFYLLMLLVVIAALDSAGMTEAALPISNFVDTLIQSLPLIAKALLILVMAFAAAKILSQLLALILGGLSLDIALAEVTEGETQPFSQTAAQLLFWLIMMVGLAGAFEALEIEIIAAPMRNLLSKSLQLLPALAVALLLLLGGWLLGNLTQNLLRNLLHSLGFDRLVTQLRQERLFEKMAPSSVVAWLSKALIMLHALIAAFEHLGLHALSEPLQGVIQQLWTLLPSLALSLLIIIMAFLGGRFLGNIISGILEGLGLDELFSGVGLRLERLSKRVEEQVDMREGLKPPPFKPSQILGKIARLLLMLLALGQVFALLGLELWAGLLGSFLRYLLLHALTALIIVGLGLLLANFVRDLLLSSTEGSEAARRWVAQAARLGVLIFAFTMALQQLQLAPSFILLSFGLIFGALCLALALAFGLGGREIAQEIIREQYRRRREQRKTDSDNYSGL